MDVNITDNTNINNSGHCNYFVVRKKRYCRMTVKSGFLYCGEHEPKQETEDTNSRLRIPCPLDSKHTCFANKLAKHLKKCNANLTYTEPYLLKNVNLDDCEENEESVRQLSSIPTNEILKVINKVNTLFEDYISGVVTNKVLTYNEMMTEINRPDYGASTRKHLLQISSLIEHLNNANLLDNNTCYVDFGAGKGQFSFWLSQKIKSLEQSTILLVERASLRHKMDNKLNKSEENIHRIKADIADLLLNEVEVIKKGGKVVAVTKHLCGGATDLALKCLINAMKKGVDVKGLVMAFCCHHRCQWSNYTGKAFFENHHLSKAEFDIICGLVSWATCGTGRSRDHKNKPEKVETNSDRNELNYTREEKELIGRKCKLLIDYGRMNYLQNHNFTCNLYYYVEQNITLENLCIVAQKL